MKKVETAILLAGGNGTRLRPFTLYTSKHLLAVYDKPMIYYPLTNLILMGVKKIFLIINPKHQQQWEALLGTVDIDAEINLVPQNEPEGIPQAITLCKDHVRGKDFYLALGDNLLLGSGLLNRFNDAIIEGEDHSVIIGYPVENINKFGIAEFDVDQAGHEKLRHIVEKPKQSSSNIAVIGLYYFGSSACNVASKLKKSARGEYEIADLINHYIKQDKCSLVRCNLATDFWLDTGSPEALTSASILLREMQRSGERHIGTLGKTKFEA